MFPAFSFRDDARRSEYGRDGTRVAQVAPNWQNQDLQRDGVFGISTDKAYDQLLTNKKPSTVVVAVIDSGIDTAQIDLSSVLWTDPDNGSHGRNYIVSEIGKEDFIPMFENKKGDRDYRKTLADYNLHVQRLETFMSQLKEAQKILEHIQKNIGKERPSLDDFKQYQPRDEAEQRILGLVLDRLEAYPDFDRFRYCELDHLLEIGQYHLEHGLKMGPAFEDHTGGGFNADVSNDDLGLITNKNGMCEHGTMASGIIAAVRNNGKDINGIFDDTRIMMLKLFNNIREMRNDDLAAAIRFAVDHGERVISMSFGKSFSWHREAVDKAVKYAMSRDVLIVHAAGKEGWTWIATPSFLRQDTWMRVSPPPG